MCYFIRFKCAIARDLELEGIGNWFDCYVNNYEMILEINFYEEIKTE